MPVLRLVGSCSELSVRWKPQRATGSLEDSCVGPDLLRSVRRTAGLDIRFGDLARRCKWGHLERKATTPNTRVTPCIWPSKALSCWPTLESSCQHRRGTSDPAWCAPAYQGHW